MFSGTKQINVYGKRSRRVVCAPPDESSDVAAKPDRVPLIHRMKKRENGHTLHKLAVKSKPSSPQRSVSLTKQRAVPGGLPTRKGGVKRGLRVAEILAEEASRAQEHRYLKEVDVAGKKNVPGTPSRVPLSTISTNALKSPALSSVQVVVRKKKKDYSPKSLATSKALSTVQVDIEVLDDKGQMVKREKRIARTDVVHHSKETGEGKTSRKSEIRIAAAPRSRPIHLQSVPSPAEAIRIASAVDGSLSPIARGTNGSPILLSSGSSPTRDVELSSPELLPARKSKRATVNIIISDDEDEERSDEERDTYSPPDSPPVPSMKPLQKSKSSARKSLAYDPKGVVPVPSARPPSSLKVEVVIPPASYRLRKPTPPPASPPRRTRFPTASLSQDGRQKSPKIRKKPSGTSALEQLNIQVPIPSRYPALSYSTSYNLIPSPPLKGCQLTPIRYSKTKGNPVNSSLFGYGRGKAPSPTTTTDSDFDLSFELSQLNIGIDPEELEALRQQGINTHLDSPEYLRPLLEECHQENCGPYEFSAFIESFPFDPVLQDAKRNLGNTSEEILTFRKIGEASYSEVFGIGDVVLKVVPLRDESRSGQGGVEGPAPTDAKDVRKEIIVTRAMGEVHEGFVKLLKTYVVRGKYPEVLLNLWDEYNERKGSESVRPDTFTVSQMYAIIVLPNGGPDLEAYAFSNSSKTGWRQASSLFWQVAKALAHAEQLVSFEHRDLHWGQILVKDIQRTNKPIPLRSITHTLNHAQKRGSVPFSSRVYMDDLEHGVQGTIIDLGLSRMDAGDGSDEGVDVQWTPFEEEVFMGEGDYQFDVYRLMKWCTGEKWEGYHPLTNVMWLHYLVIKLLRHKNLKAPVAPRKSRLSTTAKTITPIDPTRILHNIRPTLVNPPPSSSGQFSEKDCYDALVEIEEWLGRRIAEITPPVIQKSKGRARLGKTTTIVATQGRMGGDSATASTCSCARQVVGYGVKRGWIRPVSS